MRPERPKTIEFWRGRMPHWEVENRIYFITIHLVGAIPASAAKRTRTNIESHSQCENLMQRKIFHEMERWLDHSPVCRYLADSEVASMVVEAIEHRCANGIWNAFEYVVMPSHIHALLEFLAGDMKTTLEDFKRWTARLAMKQLKLEHRRFWQREWFDHWVRSNEEGNAICEYIRQNPVKAGLVSRYQDWPYGSWHRK